MSEKGKYDHWFWNGWNTPMSEERKYDHWFWNGPFINWVAQKVVDFDGWLFKKQCGE